LHLDAILRHSTNAIRNHVFPGLFKEKLKEWEDFHNYRRPYSAIGGQTPYERFQEEVGLFM
jgi:transposase InsO family protein